MIIWFACIGIVMLSIYLQATSHELVHAKALAYLDYNATIEFRHGIPAATNTSDIISAEDRHYIYLGDMMNEAVDYNVTPYLWAIMILLLGNMLINARRSDKHEI